MEPILSSDDDSLLAPSESTRLIVECCEVLQPLGRVLVIGGGRGYIPIALALMGASVTSIDVNPNAARVTIENARASGVGDQVQALVRDVRTFSEGPSYDLVVSNPPQQPSAPWGLGHGSACEWNHNGGVGGLELTRDIFSVAQRVLVPGASLVISHFSFVREALWRSLVTAFEGASDTVLASIERTKGPTTEAMMARDPAAYEPQSLVEDTYTIEIHEIRFSSVALRQ